MYLLVLPGPASDYVGLGLGGLVALVAAGRFDGASLRHALAAGVLASVVPYAADLVALRRIPPRLFGMFMSVHPVLAALSGLVVLGQALDPHEVAGMGVVVTVNAVAVLAAARRSAAGSVTRRSAAGSVARRADLVPTGGVCGEDSRMVPARG